jgi:hypothetical protein
MGADIYLNSEYEPHLKQWQPIFEAAVSKRDGLPRDSEQAREAQKEVDAAFTHMRSRGYFRDAYNGGNLASLIGFSWWQDVVPMLDDGFLPIPKAHEFIAMLEAKPVTAEAVKARLERWRLEGHTSQDPFEEWLKGYQGDHARLIALLKRSIELNEPLYCSL